MFGGWLGKGIKLLGFNLAVTSSQGTPSLESMWLVQYWRILYWRCDRKSANPPNIIPRQYFRLYGSMKLD